MPGAPRDYVDHHPITARLIVEVADSSLDYDRSGKVRVYARNRVPEYWIFNLRDWVLEIHRQPLARATASPNPARRMNA